MTVPIPDFYWLLDGQLLAGEYPGSWTRSGATEKLGLFLAAGIRAFIDVTDDTDPHDHYDSTLRELAREHGIEYRYIRFGIEDLGIPTRELMGEILAAIKTELDEGRPVYFHWLEGIGRTGTVAGCWLVEQGMSADDALGRCRCCGGDRPIVGRGRPRRMNNARSSAMEQEMTTDLVPRTPDHNALEKILMDLLSEIPATTESQIENPPDTRQHKRRDHPRLLAATKPGF